ncbi:hypothetical protein KCV06_g19, partial [Aureobasidium melanogenum]
MLALCGMAGTCIPCGVRLFNRKCKRDPSIDMDAASTRKVCLPSESVADTFLHSNPLLSLCTLLLNDDLFHKNCLIGLQGLSLQR